MCLFEIGKIFICDGFKYLGEGEMYWENNLKRLSRVKSEVLERHPQKSFAGYTLQTVGKIGNTFSASSSRSSFFLEKGLWHSFAFWNYIDVEAEVMDHNAAFVGKRRSSNRSLELCRATIMSAMCQRI